PHDHHRDLSRVARCPGIGRQVPWSQSGSTPHDNDARAASLQVRSLTSLLLRQPQQRSPKYQTLHTNRAKKFIVRCRKTLAYEPHRRRPLRWIIAPSLSRLIRGSQIPIAHAALPPLNLSRFPPLEVFRRRPPSWWRPRQRAGIRKPSQFLP